MDAVEQSSRRLDGDLPLPLLFGCIPLGEVISGGEPGRQPREGAEVRSEARTQVESFFNGLVRLYRLRHAAGHQPANSGRGVPIAASPRHAWRIGSSSRVGLRRDAGAPTSRRCVNQLTGGAGGVHAQVQPLLRQQIQVAPPLGGTDRRDRPGPNGGGQPARAPPTPRSAACRCRRACRRSLLAAANAASNVPHDLGTSLRSR